jgi:hypothetical protein
MARTPRPWIVTPHDPPQKLEENLWIVEGEVPKMAMRRRMMIARRADGGLLFFNAVPLRDDALAEVKAWGRPDALIVPNQFHRLDAHAFRERLGVKLYCPRAAMGKVKGIVSVDGAIEDVPGDASIAVTEVAGSKGEAVMRVTTGGRVSLIFADVFMNIPRPIGIIMRLLGTAGGAKCPPLFRMIGVRDRLAVRGAIEELAATPGLARLIPSHGDVLDRDPAGTLRAIAARDLR